MTTPKGAVVEQDTLLAADDIAKEAYAEMDAEKNGDALPDKDKEQKPEAKPAEPAEQPAEEVAEPSEEKPAEKPAEEEAKPAEGEEAKPKEEPKTPTEEEQIQEHAIKNSLTFAEAKEELTQVKAVAEKYKGNPIEMAKALRSTQSAYDKLKAEAAKPKTVIQQDPRLEINQYVAQNKAKLVEQYRAKYPAKSDLMTDEAILEDVTEIASQRHAAWRQEEAQKIKASAGQKRESSLAEIPDADKRYIPDVKALLQRYSDAEVMDESFNVRDVIAWAKGQRFDDEVKAAEERGYKRGQEETKIIGAKTGAEGKPPAKKPESTGLSDKQKARAHEMFPHDSPEEAEAMFKDTYKEELKKDKNFIY